MKIPIKKHFNPALVKQLNELERSGAADFEWKELSYTEAEEYYLICLNEGLEYCAKILESELYHTHKKGLCVVPRDIFKHFSASMLSLEMAKLVRQTTTENFPAFLSKVLSKYYPPSFALYISYLMAISFNQEDVADILDIIIRQFPPIAQTMPFFLNMCLKDSGISAELAALYEESNTISEDLEVHEDIEKHDTLNPVLFQDNKLRPEIKEKAIEIADELIQMMEESGVKVKIQDLIITGSNANYNYTKDSDVDLHLVVDTSKLDDPSGLYPVLFDNFKSAFNRKYDITFYDIPVEVYIESGNSLRVSKGVYSVYKDAWVEEPKQEEIPDIDLEVVDQELSPWVDRYKTIIKNTDRDSTTDSAEIEAYIDELYKLRQKGLSSAGEYSTENLIFKEIRNLGYLDKLKELLDIVTTNRLSLSGEANLEEDYDYGTKPIIADEYIDTSVASTFATRDLLQGKKDHAYENLTYNIVNVTPNQYFELCSVVQDSSVSDLKLWVSYDKRTLEDLRKVITEKKEQFPLPYVNFTDNYEIGSQEGKHRMYVLGELFGWDSKKFPVMVIQEASSFRPIGYWLQQAIK